MTENYCLPRATHEHIYLDLFNNLIRPFDARAHPTAVFLGGQPGSGKSRLTDIAVQVAFNGKRPVVINGDDFRSYHPQATEIYELHDKRYAELTDPDVRKWTPELLEAAVEGSRDIVFESTMRNREPLMSTLKSLKARGYMLWVMVMATPFQLSRAGIVFRYETQKAAGSIARWTPFEIHDEAVRNVPGTLSAIEDESPVDAVLVYNRDGERLYSNGLDAPFKRLPFGKGASLTVLKEVSRLLNRAEMRVWENSIATVEKLMSLRGADAEYALIKRELDRVKNLFPSGDS